MTDRQAVDRQMACWVLIRTDLAALVTELPDAYMLSAIDVGRILSDHALMIVPDPDGVGRSALQTALTLTPMDAGWPLDP